MEAYIGAIWSFGFNFAPYGWALCNGALVAISNNEALYALIGTTYGGDGQTTFALPNLQGRVPIGTGQGPTLSNYVIGQAAGSESVTLLSTNLPPHNHFVLSAQLPVSSRGNESVDPNGNYFGASSSASGNTYNTTGGVTMHPSTGMTSVVGNNVPVSILNQFQVVNYCICMEGIFPSRS